MDLLFIPKPSSATDPEMNTVRESVASYIKQFQCVTTNIASCHAKDRYLFIITVPRSDINRKRNYFYGTVTGCVPVRHIRQSLNEALLDSSGSHQFPEIIQG